VTLACGYRLDPRPCAPLNRVKEGAHASLGPTPPDDFCNDDEDARAQPVSVRSSPVPSERPFLRTAHPTRLPSAFPCASCEEHGMRQPKHFRDGQAASHYSPISALLTAPTSSPKAGTLKAIAPRTVACGRRYEPAGGCADDRLKRWRRAAWAELPGAKDLHSICHATPHGETAGGSPPPRLLEHPMVASPEGCKGLECPLALTGARQDPRSHVPPRRETHSRRSGCFPPLKTRRTAIARRVLRPQSILRHATARSHG